MNFVTSSVTGNYLVSPISQTAVFTPTMTYSAMTTTYTATVWQNWVVTYTSSAIWNNWYAQQVEVTVEQLEALQEQQAWEAAALEVQRQRYREEEKQREEKRKAARIKARELLLSLLDAEQEKQYAEEGSFELRTDKRRYRIKPGDRVEELDLEGNLIARLCIHPPDYEMPREDWAIAQKLMLETDEETFHRVANRSVA